MFDFKQYLILIFSFQASTYCIFNYAPENINLPALSTGVLNQNEFNYTWVSSNIINGFPKTIFIQSAILGYSISLTLNQVKSNLMNSFQSSRVFLQSSTNSKLNVTDTAKTSFQLYTDTTGSSYATLINNSDMKANGLNTFNYNYRIVLTTFIHGTQIDVQFLLMYDLISGQQTNCRHIYFVRSNIANDDLSNSPNYNDPCFNNPCNNGGTCMTSLSNSYVCFCADYFSGPTCDSLVTTTMCPACNGYEINFRNDSSTSPCIPNPCQNNGMCSVVQTTSTFSCLCINRFTGPTCENMNMSPGFVGGTGRTGFLMGKSLEKEENIEILKNKWRENAENIETKNRRERSVPVNSQNNAQNLFIEYLIVIENTVYDQFVSLFGNLNPPSLLNDYINIFFSQVLNGVNQRYLNSFSNDPELSLTVSLKNVLIYLDPSITQWTNATLVSIPSTPTFNNIPTVSNTVSLSLFADYMNNLPNNFSSTYDYAVGVMNLDIWDSNSKLSLQQRRGVVGFTSPPLGCICGSHKYSIIEFNGFTFVQNAAHELGHALGAAHDGSSLNSPQCPASANYIMTPATGIFSNLSNLYYFSNCSISMIKNTLLTSQKTITTAGQCLLNIPAQAANSLYNATQYPGQCYSLDQQCQLIFGLNSRYCNGTYNGKNNDLNLCQTLYCKTGKAPGPCLTGGNSVAGQGGVDGTPCYVTGSTADNVCIQGVCQSKSSLNMPTCSTDMCPLGCVTNPFAISTTPSTTILTTTTTSKSTKITTASIVQSLNVEYLIVLDSTIYQKFQAIYPALQTYNDMFQFLKVYYGKIAEGVNKRFSESLANDANLRIQVTLVNIILYQNPSDTPWTNISTVGIPGIPIFNRRIPINSALSLASFQNFMNNLQLNYPFDYAVAITGSDLWSSAAGKNDSRSSLTAFTNYNSICSTSKYSIIEDQGLNTIENAAHGLGSTLGAVNDGNNVASACKASANNIMTPSFGMYTNSSNLYYFSNCSINSFKASLLSPNRSTVSTSAQCLLNTPLSIAQPYFNRSYLAGNLFNIDTQCSLAIGNGSLYSPCAEANDPICNTLFCNDPVSGNCFSQPAFGAEDGTSCGINKICYHSKCVNSSIVSYLPLPASPCSRNPCQNGGQCIPIANFYICHCINGSTDFNCASSSASLLTTTTKTTKKLIGG